MNNLILGLNNKFDYQEYLIAAIKRGGLVLREQEYWAHLGRILVAQGMYPEKSINEAVNLTIERDKELQQKAYEDRVSMGHTVTLPPNIPQNQSSNTAIKIMDGSELTTTVSSGCGSCGGGKVI